MSMNELKFENEAYHIQFNVVCGEVNCFCRHHRYPTGGLRGGGRREHFNVFRICTQIIINSGIFINHKDQFIHYTNRKIMASP
jgi:hypothetical protein